LLKRKETSSAETETKHKMTAREEEGEKEKMRTSVDQDARTPNQRIERTREMFERVQEWIDRQEEDEEDEKERSKSLFVESFRELASSF